MSALPSLATLPVDLMQGAPKPPTGDTREKIVKTAKDFEASFITVMLGEMFNGVGEGPMSGGSGGAMFKSFLLDAFAKQMSRSGGGIGISGAVQREMLKLQGLEG